jgi:hypothetical protein
MPVSSTAGTKRIKQIRAPQVFRRITGKHANTVLFEDNEIQPRQQPMGNERVSKTKHVAPDVQHEFALR